MAVLTYSQSSVGALSSSTTTTDFGLPVSDVLIRTVDPVTITGIANNEILSFTFPYAPNQYVIDGLSDDYQQLSRPGLAPLVQFSARRLRTIAFKVLVTSNTAKGYLSAETNAEILTAIARSKTDLVVVGLGPLVSSLRYRMTEFSITSRRLNEEQRMTMFDASIVLTQKVSLPQTVPGMTRIVIPNINLSTGTSSGSTPSGDFSYWDSIGNAIDNGYTPPPSGGSGGSTVQ